MWHMSAMLASFFALIVFGPLLQTRGYRILAIETMSGKSHWNYLSAVIGALTDVGHSVTVFTPFPEGDRENYTEVDMSEAFPILLARDLTVLRSSFANKWTMINFLVEFSRHTCDRLHEYSRLREYVAGGLSAQFDAVLVEPARWDCVSCLAAESGLPLIYASPTSMAVFLQGYRVVFGDIPNPAVVAPVFADHAIPRTFAQRFINVASTLYGAGLWAFRELLVKTTDPKPYDSRPTVPPSLVFVNGHYASAPASPIPSNVVNIGGVHLKPVKKIQQEANGDEYNVLWSIGIFSFITF